MSQLHGVSVNPPFWRLAVQQFLDASFTPGDVIPHAWFHEALGITFPSGATTLHELQKAELQYLSGINRLIDHLVREHQIRLWNCRGIGYRWLQPGEQTEVCYEESQRELRNVIRKLGRDLLNVDHAALTAEQKKVNLDALAKLGALRSMKRRELRLLPRQQEPPAQSEAS